MIRTVVQRSYDTGLAAIKVMLFHCSFINIIRRARKFSNWIWAKRILIWINLVEFKINIQSKKGLSAAGIETESLRTPWRNVNH